MSISDQITDLINQEVQKKVQEALSNYADVISKSYKIPLNLLLRDIPKNITTDINTVDNNLCIGIRKGNIRCKMTGKYEGYCRHHFIQKRKIEPILILQKTTNTQQQSQESQLPERVCQTAPSTPRIRPLIDYRAIL